MTMMMKNNSAVNQPPVIFRTSEVLVPVRIDITHKGIRIIDSFCWPLSLVENEYRKVRIVKELRELAERMVLDMNLPFGFIDRIERQLMEQLDSHFEIINLCRLLAKSNDPNCSTLIKKWAVVRTIMIVIRYGTVEYEDKIQWDPMSSFITPEFFAQTTVSDLKLPVEMGPIIAHRIREYLFRCIVHTLSDTENDFVEEDVEVSTETPQVTILSSQVASTMSQNLWERAKPVALEDNASFPQPLLPKDRNSNASVWDNS